jgi:NIMA (never in mitosis gene a)-related kinase
MEFCDGGDIMQKIETSKKTRSLIKEEDIWNYFIQMITGIKSLHDMKICHRDLKVSQAHEVC